MRLPIKSTWSIFTLYCVIFSLSSTVFADEQITFPYEQCFTVTGYYSPLPDQEKFATGSYQSEIRLEGRGTNGADGRQVYLGMLAAPPEIPFGTKITIPGVGTGTVHDRGGAIKTRQGECGSSLDVWMGFGDKGRERSINWGVRRVKAMVHGMNENIQENVILEGYSEAESMLREKIIFFKPRHFTQDLGPGDKNEDVERLQMKLLEWGYFRGDVTGLYGPETQDAVFKFQTEFDVLTNPDTLGSGYFGINTRTAFDRAVLILDGLDKDTFPLNLGVGAAGPHVRALQEKLISMGYLSADMLTERYDDQTLDAVLTFQLDFSVIRDSFDSGAGFFGPNTRATMALVSSKKQFESDDKSEHDVSSPSEIVDQIGKSQESLETIPATLSIGDSGGQVRNLQLELTRLGYFRHEITGYYGTVTAHAVFKLQQAWGLVSSQNDPAAGRVDSNIASKLNLVSQQRFEIKTLIAANRILIDDTIAQVDPALEPSVTIADATFSAGAMDFGDSGDAVRKLQEKLKNLGYFKGGFITDYYGEFTKQAVLSFQLDKGIIKSSDELGAGRVGEKTMEVLMRS